MKMNQANAIEDIMWTNLKKLCEKCEYMPEDIGCAVLEACGFNVKRYISGGIAVKDSQGRLLNYYSN